MKVKVHFTKGIPGSGKSTYALNFCKENKGWVRVCRDEIRLMRGNYWVPEQEEWITSIERNAVKEAIINGYNVIVDAMNLSSKYMNSWKEFLNNIEAIEDVNIEIDYIDFTTTNLKTCIERDAMRPKERRVGEVLIKEFYYKYIADVKPVLYTGGLPHAIICDIDGTVADGKGHRSFYDYTKVGDDAPKPQIIKIVEWYLASDTNSVLFMSGRDDSCEEVTRRWLLKHIQLKNDEFLLFMRKTGDKRQDSIVKRELFERYIRGTWNIDFCLDDRNQVVDMWRNELSLTCLQVAEGNF